MRAVPLTFFGRAGRIIFGGQPIDPAAVGFMDAIAGPMDGPIGMSRVVRRLQETVHLSGQSACPARLERRGGFSPTGGIGPAPAGRDTAEKKE